MIYFIITIHQKKIFEGISEKKMKICAIICEYNPFHRGHAKQIAQIRSLFDEEVCILSLMSGCFVQRGEPALLPPYDRAKTAIAGGSDLVLELPYPFSCAPAEVFAESGVSLLTSLGKVDHLCFGSERESGEAIEACARRLLSKTFEETLSAFLKMHPDLSFPRAREAVYRSLFQEDFFPTRPNEILAVEYDKALIRQRSAIRPLCLKRENDGFSATASRAVLRQGGDASSLLPTSVLPLIEQAQKQGGFADLQRIESLILGHFRLSERRDRFFEASSRAEDLPSFFAALADKNHTAAHDRREVIHRLCALDGYEKIPLYTRLLAANRRGRAALKTFDPAFPILTKPAHYTRLPAEAQKQFLTDLRASRLYALCLPKGRRNENLLLASPFIDTTDEA
ncbi:MAG: nucleotidyltransferase family protein [Ruminococcaceae bacterium]|nr:nucleotidyltransferase family protein [Oscillospiraceae bacterium]